VKKICPECGRMGESMFCSSCWPNGYLAPRVVRNRERNNSWRLVNRRPKISVYKIKRSV